MNVEKRHSVIANGDDDSTHTLIAPHQKAEPMLIDVEKSNKLMNFYSRAIVNPPKDLRAKQANMGAIQGTIISTRFHCGPGRPVHWNTENLSGRRKCEPQEQGGLQYCHNGSELGSWPQLPRMSRCNYWYCQSHAV